MLQPEKGEVHPHPFMVGVPEDPMPWLTEKFSEYGVYDPKASEVVRLARILGVAQSTVNSLSDGKRSFRVKFTSTHGTAYTDGKTFEVVIGTKPALDAGLTDGQRAAILVSMAAHEVGHVRWSIGLDARLKEHYEKTSGPFKAAWASRVFNIAHDIHLEHWMRQDFPVLRAILDLKGLYFCSPWTFKDAKNTERYGSLINATLYPHATDWNVSPESVQFKLWADAWAIKAKTKSVRTLKGAIAIIEEALEFLRYDEQDELPPRDKPTDGDGGGDGEPEPGEDGDGSDDEGQPSSSPPARSDGESEPGESGDESGDDGEDDGDDDGDGEPEEDGTCKGSGDTERESKGRPDDEPEEGDIERKGVDEGGATTSYDDLGDTMPTIHGEMHTADDADWQDAIDSWQKTQTSERDRFIVGGGQFAYREMRVVRITK